MKFLTSLAFAFLLSSIPLWGQYQLSGTVLDENNEGMAFVNIIVNNDPYKGVSTDVDGRFEIASNEPIQQLTVSYVGYDDLAHTLTEEEQAKGELQLKMSPSAFDLGEVVVLAGENPAHRIIRLAVKNKNGNDHEKLKSYKCEVYSKAEFGYSLRDTAQYEQRMEQQKGEKNPDFIKPESFQRPFLFSEVVSERYFKQPGIIRNKLLHNRLSGLKKTDLSALNNFDQFSFYDDFIRFGEVAYPNPVSKGSTKKYFYNIVDTLYQAGDTVFVMTYKPKKGKKFDGLEGLLYINSRGYAIQNLSAEPAGATAINFKFEHQYKYLEDEGRWFPNQFYFAYTMPFVGSEDYADIRYVQRSYISKAAINPVLSGKDMKDDFIPLQGEVISRDEQIWEQHRVVPLTDTEKLVYHRMDSIGAKKRLDLLINIPLSLIAGKYGMGQVDLIWNEMVQINNYERVRLGVGLETNKGFSRYFSFGGFLGYGWADKEFKYGGKVVVDLIPDDLLEVRYSYSNDIFEPGGMRFNLQDNAFLSNNLYAANMDRVESHYMAIQSQYQFLRSAISLERASVKPLYPYSFRESADSSATYQFTEAAVSFRYAFGEQNNWFMGVRLPSNTTYPILYFSYKKGFDNLLDGAYDYHKVSVALEQKFNTHSLGETKYRLEGGWISGDVPYPKLYVPGGTGGFFSIINIRNTFQTIGRYEFASQRFVNLFLEHDFGNFLLRKKYSQPSFAILHNMGIGALDNPDIHGGTGVTAVPPSKGFFESGIGINNLIVIPIIQNIRMGIGARGYYRYGAYQSPNTRDNIAIRVNFSILL